jgi:type IV pilus assembly protein PilB
MAELIKKLVERGIVGEDEALSLEEEIRNSNKREEEILIEKNLYPEEALFEIKSELSSFPFKNKDQREVSLKALEFIPEESAKFYKIIPLNIDQNVLEVGMVFPEDRKAQEVLNFLSRQNNFTYKVFLISLSGFNEAVKQYRNLKKEFSKALEGLEGEIREEKTKEKKPVFEKKPLSDDAPVIKMVDVILRYAVDGEASDIHIEPFQDKSRVRFRIDGTLHASIFLPAKVHSAIVARIKILSNLKIDETRVPQDGRFSEAVYSREIDFRVSTFPTVLGEKVVMRVLVVGEGVQTLDRLGLQGRNLDVVQEAIKRPYGLIFSTGPTGSGKTTTLYSLLNILNKEKVNIVTLEDPIEYFLKGVNHSQTRPEINYGFAEGLRHILRQDPDVIMVGEARDQETATLTIHAALTGHIVLSSLHTNNAIGVIPRLIDMGVQPFLIPSSLVLAIAQRLAGFLCPDCKKKKKPIPKMMEIISKEVNSLPESEKKGLDLSFSEVCEAEGCKKCNWRGYKGRIGLFEILSMTDQLSDIIVTGPSEERILKEAQRQGMITLRQDGIIKALKGITSIEEVLRVTEE